MDVLSELFLSFIPLAFLSAVISIGYYFAWTDFKPTKIDSPEDFRSTIKSTTDRTPSKRALTDLELGLNNIDTISGLSDKTQKRLKMEKMIRQYSQNSPNETAGVIKGWLSDI